MENSVEKKLEQTPPQKRATWITLRFILALALFVATLIILVTIADEIVLKNKNHFDVTISNYVSSFVSPSLTVFMEHITFFGSFTFLFPAYIILILYYFFIKKSGIALDIAMIGFSSTGILFLLKDIFKRHRPSNPLIDNVAGFSFPSGHSFSSFTFFGILIYIIWQSGIKKGYKVITTCFFFLLASIIAFSRVYLRVHYPSDVVAGFCLSIIWLMIALWLLHKADRGFVSIKK